MSDAPKQSYKRNWQDVVNAACADWSGPEAKGFTGRIIAYAGVSASEASMFEENWVADHRDPGLVGEHIQDELTETIEARKLAAKNEVAIKLLESIVDKPGVFEVRIFHRPHQLTDSQRCMWVLEALAVPKDGEFTTEMLQNAGLLQEKRIIEADCENLRLHHRKLFNDREAFEIERYAYRDRQRAWWRRFLMWLAS